MTDYLTADDARMLNPSKILEKWIKDTEGRIQEVAKAGLTSCKVAYEIWEGWPVDSKSVPLLKVTPGREFAAHFTEQGFKVEIYYETKQFVDLGIRVSWKGV